mgnify:FL=1
MGFFEYLSPNSVASSQTGVRTDFNKPVYKEFVQGTVTGVITYDDSLGSEGVYDTNAIYAKPDRGDELLFSQLSRQKYYPLFRGIVDTPAIGEPVLLCEFEGIFYYIGPLNTDNDPNYNEDYASIQSPSVQTNTDSNVSLETLFPKKGFSRLQKICRPSLDDPKQERESAVINENHGDLILEGRFGNSIRLGSNHQNPKLIISNNRSFIDPEESFLDGSLFSMTSFGSLNNHFSDSGFETTNFILGSDEKQQDKSKEKKRLIGEGNPENENAFDYNYGVSEDNLPILKEQIFINSGRVTINSHENNITLSSFYNFDIGSGNNLTINTSNFTSIESKNIYLGKQAQEQNQAMVLGNKLNDILTKLFELFESAHGLVQGVPVPLTDATGIVLRPKISTLKSEISEILSQYHFIEENKGQK